MTLATDELADAIVAFETAYDALFRVSASLEEWNRAAETYRRARRRRIEVETAIRWEGRAS